MSDFFAALGLAAVIVGLAAAASPDQMKKQLSRINAMPVSRIRVIALACAAGGLVLLWAVRG